MFLISFKRGDTFLLTCTYTVDGALAVLPETVRAQIREPGGNLVAELTVVRDNGRVGGYTLNAAPEATRTWPLLRALCDIEYADAGGQVSSTESFAILVLQDVTHD